MIVPLPIWAKVTLSVPENSAGEATGSIKSRAKIGGIVNELATWFSPLQDRLPQLVVDPSARFKYCFGGQSKEERGNDT
jgi:hypothetical protein